MNKNLKKAIGVGVTIAYDSNNKEIIEMHGFYTYDNGEIYHKYYDYISYVKHINEAIIKSGINMNVNRDKILITDYIIIPKSIITNYEIISLDDIHRVFVEIKGNDKFFVMDFTNIKEAEKFKNDIQKMMNEDLRETIESMRKDLEKMKLTMNEQSNNSGQVSKEENLSIHDDLPLDVVDKSKIKDINSLKKIIDEIIERIKINEECGTTIADISASICNKLGKLKLERQETLYLKNALREKFPNRLLKSGKSYSLCDIDTKKYTSATTVFKGLLFEDRPRKLPKALRR